MYTRVRLVGSSVALGFVLTVIAFIALSTRYSIQFTSTQLFALSVLVLGFGVLGWSGSILTGTSIENAQRYLDTRTNWTEADSRRAMARVASVGAGGMAGVIVMTMLLQ